MYADNINKRHGIDGFIRSKRFFIVTGWVILFVAFLFLSFSKPKTDTMFDRFYDTMSFGAWDKNLIRYTYNLMYPLLIASAIGLFLNSFRHKRSSDTYSKSLIIFLLLSVAVIIIYNAMQ